MRILIAGGGTGGHIIPALAIARALETQHGAEVRFVGTARGLETRLVPQAGYPLDLISVGPLNRVGLATKLKTFAILPKAVVDCLRLIHHWQPDVVAGVGGYASGPAMLAALLRHVPTLAFEPNAAPGMTNRMIGKYVTRAAVNFAPTLKYFRNAELTGIPVRVEFSSLAPKPVGSSLRLLVLGGSQGALPLNRTMPEIARELLESVPGLVILHQAGARHEEMTHAAYAASGAPAERWEVRAFLEEMPKYFAEADLILARSGASTVAELTAAGKPSLLVPFPLAADDHQRRNAEVLLAARAAAMLLEHEMTGAKLLQTLRGLLENPEELKEMAENARSLGRPAAATRIAAIIASLVPGRSGLEGRATQ
jgi:UDP-N-acetylglucosamine--N-acetylmuramyl-(pentapeptide) pyrophosphoryl-undecaprenol N-acetylglucosamine transferase